MNPASPVLAQALMSVYHASVTAFWMCGLAPGSARDRAASRPSTGRGRPGAGTQEGRWTITGSPARTLRRHSGPHLRRGFVRRALPRVRTCSHSLLPHGWRAPDAALKYATTQSGAGQLAADGYDQPSNAEPPGAAAYTTGRPPSC